MAENTGTPGIEAQLQETIEKLLGRISVYEKQVADLTEEKTVIEAVNAELQKEIETLSAKQPASVAEAAAEAQKKEPPTIPSETFEVDGVEYKFITPVFMHNKQKVLAATAINDTALLQVLVSKKSGVIVTVNG